jgi:hypothetical protein
MPCYMTGSAEGDAREAAHEANLHLTQLTRMLCSVLLRLEEDNMLKSYTTTETQQWWKQHLELDARRLREEAKVEEARRERETALAKLTKKERKVLGL